MSGPYEVLPSFLPDFEGLNLQLPGAGEDVVETCSVDGAALKEGKEGRKKKGAEVTEGNGRNENGRNGNGRNGNGRSFRPFPSVLFLPSLPFIPFPSVLFLPSLPFLPFPSVLHFPSVLFLSSRSLRPFPFVTSVRRKVTEGK